MAQCTFCGTQVNNQSMCPHCGLGTGWLPESDERTTAVSTAVGVAKGAMGCASVVGIIAVIVIVVYAIQIMSALSG